MSDYPGNNPVGRLYGSGERKASAAAAASGGDPVLATAGQQQQQHQLPPPPPPITTRLTAKPHVFAGAVLSPKHARDLNPTLCMAITSSLAEQNNNKASVPYTLWITEAWRVLGWAEPSAALFWEIATMYHTLQAAGRDYYSSNYHHYPGMIPPILSCGSTSSLTSGATSSHATERLMDKKRFSSAVSAKELPVWLVGTFLLLHCEEFACQRSLSGEDERRFYGAAAAAAANTVPASATSGGRMDFTSLFRNQSLSPRYVQLLLFDLEGVIVVL